MKVVLSIHPVYVRRILSGEKTFEFRKRPFGRPVDTLVIYEAAPQSFAYAPEGTVSGRSW